ncbi:surfactin synthase thioesterase subunit [Paenibacillus shirakamiensis]|uniref:Surfactin synthase thioesterase subunit n=1 Tax=Paenibacillus shirakamiensis TaxID=1265935 RepID=A0ABS4JB96_9BACL|nr:thioesterase [Paenibacillus shirakamiensis]MBP1998984.1 surfactin synthase thioesterase subunit [Paenibacillus shirakamiensis]
MKNDDVIYLLCFPYGGGGASVYSEWNKQLSPKIKVVPIQLPGREREIGEDPFTDLNKAADHYATIIEAEYVNKRIAFFGHCFLGSTLAFEVIRRLESVPELNIEHLFASAAFSPSSIRDYGIDLEQEDEFITKVEKLTGLKNEAFDIPDLKELLMPTFKADFEMDIKYPVSHAIVNIPISAIYADHDVFVSRDEVEQWKQHTSKDYELYEVEGEHMYLLDRADLALHIVEKSLLNYSEGSE